MPDPIARKRLKKKMLDRWENEGGSIVSDNTAADTNTPASENKGRGKKLPAPRDNYMAGGPASPTKRRKPAQK